MIRSFRRKGVDRTTLSKVLNGRAPNKDLPLEFLIIDFYQVGAHENFYEELKHYLRQESSKGETK